MNAGRVPFEAPKERSRVCFGGFRPTKLVEEPRVSARGAPHMISLIPRKITPISGEDYIDANDYVKS